MTEKPIVVGVDGTTDGERALVWALDEAATRGCPLHVVSAWDYEPLADWTEQAETLARRRAETIMDNALRRAADRPQPPAVVRRAVRGPAAEVLESEATGAAMLVLAAHTGGGLRRSAFGRALLGTTSTHCVRRAPAPVVVLPAR
ncbi:universal stress protein [Actinosynnema pretiosum subsp. pretiosum]|uniref:Universal stress protein n=1 Tax=Actinosynnema pretiosum subsp. pretiosum TaxID=103721 RepID=A0AA45L9Z6_9PSEU|nr:universal stress protein [Actinosynnema pretiosum subsp. pretiosum]